MDDSMVGRLAELQALQQAAVLEEACEKALYHGDRGVKVVRSPTCLLSAEPDPSVPYGYIYVYEIVDRGSDDIA